MLRSSVIPIWTLAVMVLSSGKISVTTSLPADSLEQIFHLALAKNRLNTSHYRVLENLFRMFRDNVPEKAAQCCRLFLRINDPDHPDKGEALMHLGMGRLYADSADPEKAMDEFLKSLDHHLLMPAAPSLASLYNEIGLVHFRVGLYRLARDHYNQSLLTLNACRSGKESNFIRAESHNLLGQAYLKRQFPDSALEHFHAAGELLVHSDNREALTYSRKHDTLTDSLNRLDLARMEVRKILERKKNEISSLENEKKTSRKVMTRQMIIRNILIAVAVLGSLAFMVIYNRYRTLRKAHAEISRQKKEMDFLLTELGNKNRQLETSIRTSNTLFAIIGHDLKNPFNTLLGFAELLHDNYAGYTEEERKSHILRIRNSAEQLLQLLDNLLQWSSLQQGRMDPSPTLIYLHSLFDEILPVFKPQAEAKRIRLEIHIPEDIRIRADQRMVSVVLRNLISNALKFTGSGGRIRISAVAQKKQVLMEVQDTGVGIPESHRKKLFSSEGTVRTRGTDGETETGLGLYLCRQFVEKNNGKIWVKSRTGQGSSFYLTLPAE